MANFVKLVYKKLNITHLMMLFCFILVALRILTSLLLGGFFIDETNRAYAVAAIIDPNRDIPYPVIEVFNIPLFVNTDAGVSSIFFLGISSLFALVFGTDRILLRLFMSCLTILAIVLLSKSLSYFYKDSRKVFLGTMLVGFSLPWSFLQGVIFWAPTLTPVMFCVAIFCFARILHKDRFRLVFVILFPVSLILVFYTYFVAGFLAVTAYFASVIYFIKINKMSVREFLTIQIPVCIVLGLPFLLAYINDTEILMQRSRAMSIFRGSLRESALMYLNNIRALFSSGFLFFDGDGNRRHSIGHFGMLLPSAAIPIFANIFYWIKGKLTQTEKWIIIVSFIGILITFLSASLTFEGQPHSLRTSLAWPLFVLMISVGYILLIKFRKESRTSNIVCWLSIGFAVICVILYMLVFFGRYIPVSEEYFYTV